MKKMACMIVAVLLTLSCIQDSEDVTHTGSLRVHIAGSEGISIRSVPEINIDSYRLTGSGPMGQVYEGEYFNNSEVLLNNLQAGTWQVTLTGFDLAEQPVAQDAKTLEIQRGEETLWEALVTPLEGTGVLDTEITWPEQLDEQIEKEVVLINAASGVKTTLEALPDGSYAAVQLDHGYYLLQVFLQEGSHRYYGDVFLVRILADQETRFELEVTEQDIHYIGSVTVTIDHELGNPLEVCLSGPEEPLYQGDYAYIVVTVDDPPEGVYNHFRWFINGEEQHSVLDGPAINHFLDQAGIERLAVLVRSYDSETDALLQAGAASLVLNVLPEE